jgi:glycosyltransferase involved in cell wall biosynthesis
MVLFLHNRYRTRGGEERAVEDLMWLVREQLGEAAELLQRDSVGLSPAAAAAGLLGGGLRPREVADAVRLSGARVVHAHNLHPSFGWRALAAARSAGARVVLHLHQYRLVCAIGVCFTRGEECTRCHGRNTLPGVRLNCRGGRPEALAYGAALALWQRRLVEQADAIVVPSVFARERLRALGAPLPWERVRVLAPPLPELRGDAGGRVSAAAPAPEASGAERPYALVVSRLAVEKGVDVAVEACRIAGMPRVVAGDGPELERLRAQAARADVSFLGRVDDPTLAALRARAAVALAPSRSAETFGLAVAEAMAAGLPVAASRAGAIPELLDEDALVAPGDAPALAETVARIAGDRTEGMRNLERVRAVCAPEIVARGLSEAYGGDGGGRAEPST